MVENKKEKIEKSEQRKEQKPRMDLRASQDLSSEKLIRILSKDIPGNLGIYAGLTRIKGVSWAISNAVCKILSFNKDKKIASLTEQDIKKIEDFLKNPKFSNHLFNRKIDFETGENRHLIGTSLDLQKEFDIKRLKKIKSYRGIRHVAGLPLRGQRTRAHFRKNRRRSTGVKKKVKTKE